MARFALAAQLAALAAPHAAPAQRLTRPDRPWVTLETQHFRVHAPREYRAWAREVAERLDAVRDAERRAIGFAPAGRTDVVVDDPYNDPNGSAYPFQHGPAVFLWPVPPSPRSLVGASREWGELLAVHEFAHVAHLTRPSRSPWQRAWRAALPEAVGPVATRAPRWAIEGYATHVEGLVTGSGRPHSAIRAAVLRGWALDGALPPYAALGASGGGYLRGSFAYLMGSAYLEWLGARAGDSSHAALWRRLSARVNRPFDAAFAGVYGEGPAALYGRFAAQVTAEAFALRARLDSAGRVEGALVQRLAYGTGDPALSPDGRLLALEQAGGPGAPPRLVVWRVGPGAPRDTAADSAEARARRRLVRRDPDDVPAVRAFPRPLRPRAVLAVANGRAYRDPRFFPDARRVLVWRDEFTRDDVVRPDLFVWDTRTGRVTRLTRGANVREADVAPDGRTAAALRCAAGRCALVRVELATGAVHDLTRGDAPGATWSRPRWAPDGRRVTAAVHRAGRWRLAVIDVATGDVRELPRADDADHYDPTFAPDGRTLLHTSEEGGVPNVARVSADGAAGAAVTRVATAAFAPAPSAADGGVYFLHLTPHGLDLRRVAADSAVVRGGPVPLLAPGRAPARDSAAAVRAALAPRPPAAGDTVPYAGLPAGPVRERGYGAGPLRYSLLPLGTVGPDGGVLGAQLAGADPAGRRTVLAQAAAGDPRPWNGGALRAAWRGLPVTLTGELFAAQQELGARAATAGVVLPPPLAARNRYTAAVAVASAGRWFGGGARGVRTPQATVQSADAPGAARLVVGPRGVGPDVRLTARVGASAGRGTAEAVGARALGFAELGASAGGGRGTSFVSAGVTAHLATGRTAGASWQRLATAARAAVGGERGALVFDGAAAVVDRGAPAYERPLVGGAVPALFDAAVLSQRLAVPALPTGFRAGRRAAVARLTLDVGGLVPFGLTPYVAAAAAGERLRGWGRLAGVERRFIGPFAPFARLPQVRGVAGVAQVFDAPLAGRTRGYLSVTFVP